MARRAEEFTSRETWLTEHICENLRQLGLPFQEQAICQFDEGDAGYIDILVTSVPPILIEVKGGATPYVLYTAIGQLLAYSSCFPRAELCLAVPQPSRVAPRLLEVLRRVGISLWVSSGKSARGSSLQGKVPVTPHECPVCRHPARFVIDASLARGVHAGVIARQRRLSIEALLEHGSHGTCKDTGSDERGLTQPVQLQVPDIFPCQAEGVHARLQQFLGFVEAQEPPVERPFTRFKHAWQDAKDDPQEQQRMVTWLNEQLQSEDMGV